MLVQTNNWKNYTKILYKLLKSQKKDKQFKSKQSTVIIHNI